jgi:hypothetical protein
MNPYILSAVAAERVRDMHTVAERHRRAALARPIHVPLSRRVTAHVAASWSAVREFIARGQLGPAKSSCVTC